MTLYRTRWRHRDNGVCFEWFTNKSNARLTANKIRRQKGDMLEEAPVVEEVDIPTTRAGLKDWLNCNFTSDNG